MTARAILAELRQRGVEVVAAGDKIRWRPSNAVPDELRAAIVQHKTDLLALLSRPTPPPARLAYAFPWPDEVPALGPRTVGPFDHCASCQSGSWVRYGTTVQCLACARGGAPNTAAGKISRGKKGHP